MKTVLPYKVLYLTPQNILGFHLCYAHFQEICAHSKVVSLNSIEIFEPSVEE